MEISHRNVNRNDAAVQGMCPNPKGADPHKRLNMKEGVGNVEEEDEATTGVTTISSGDPSPTSLVHTSERIEADCEVIVASGTQEHSLKPLTGKDMDSLTTPRIDDYNADVNAKLDSWLERMEIVLATSPPVNGVPPDVVSPAATVTSDEFDGDQTSVQAKVLSPSIGSKKQADGTLPPTPAGFDGGGGSSLSPQIQPTHRVRSDSAQSRVGDPSCSSHPTASPRTDDLTLHMSKLEKEILSLLHRRNESALSSPGRETGRSEKGEMEDGDGAFDSSSDEPEISEGDGDGKDGRDEAEYHIQRLQLDLELVRKQIDEVKGGEGLGYGGRKSSKDGIVNLVGGYADDPHDSSEEEAEEMAKMNQNRYSDMRKGSGMYRLFRRKGIGRWMGAVSQRGILIWLSSDFKYLQTCVDPPNPGDTHDFTSVPLENVTGLVFGEASRSFRLAQSLKMSSSITPTCSSSVVTAAGEIPPYLCVSLTTRSRGVPHIDLVAKNEVDVERWVLGLNSLIPFSPLRVFFTRLDLRRSINAMKYQYGSLAKDATGSTYHPQWSEPMMTPRRSPPSATRSDLASPQLHESMSLQGTSLRGVSGPPQASGLPGSPSSQTPVAHRSKKHLKTPHSAAPFFTHRSPNGSSSANEPTATHHARSATPRRWRTGKVSKNRNATEGSAAGQGTSPSQKDREKSDRRSGHRNGHDPSDFFYENDNSAHHDEQDKSEDAEDVERRRKLAEIEQKLNEVISARHSAMGPITAPLNGEAIPAPSSVAEGCPIIDPSIVSAIYTPPDLSRSNSPHSNSSDSGASSQEHRPSGDSGRNRASRASGQGSDTGRGGSDSESKGRRPGGVHNLKRNVGKLKKKMYRIGSPSPHSTKRGEGGIGHTSRASKSDRTDKKDTALSRSRSPDVFIETHNYTHQSSPDATMQSQMREADGEVESEPINDPMTSDVL
eukprot:GHVN01089348.1.p1 GENE.GHVN01089348.1~~GHVN01089348.1.p1  ORF type:complete len:942 (-),score=199.56 GHVN01089348.1:463-3288(-)